MINKGRVQGKVAVVTGASHGIGSACAKMLAKEGAAVVVTDVLDAEGQALVDEICREDGIAGYWHLDVSNEDQVKQVMEMAMAKYGPVSILVNNAGISGVDKPTHQIALEDWEHVMHVNVTGVFLCTKHAMPQMILQRSGSIINLSSIYGIVSAPDVPPYHASKGAVSMMTKTDALLYAPYGIRVNSVHPGFIWTPMVEDYLRSKGSNLDELKKQVGELHPLGHMGDVDDIAYGVLYLASNESKFVTGTELIIDGGYTAR
jgi:NAD(P)-dependent dehydrogenase (short-subunit alcohol dehydrogenase family)